MRLHALHHLANAVCGYAERHPRHVGSCEVRAQRDQGRVKVDEFLRRVWCATERYPGEVCRCINLDEQIRKLDLTGALLDRLTQHVHILEMNGGSFRLSSSRKRQKDKEGSKMT